MTGKDLDTEVMLALIEERLERWNADGHGMADMYHFIERDDVPKLISEIRLLQARLNFAYDSCRIHDENIKKKDDVLLNCQKFFLARIPEHREYDWLDKITEALKWT